MSTRGRGSLRRQAKLTCSTPDRRFIRRSVVWNFEIGVGIIKKLASVEWKKIKEKKEDYSLENWEISLLEEERSVI